MDIVDERLRHDSPPSERIELSEPESLEKRHVVGRFPCSVGISRVGGADLSSIAGEDYRSLIRYTRLVRAYVLADPSGRAKPAGP